jgi:hypothetical protein
MYGTVPWWFPFVPAVATLLAAGFGAFFGQWFARRADAARSKKRDIALIGALIAEVEHCGKLASDYLESKYKSPAYRCHKKVYDAALPVLSGSVLTSEDVSALIGFYTHVDQFNWGLDEVNRLWKTPSPAEDNPQPPSDHYTKELSRVAVKARDMSSPASEFYTPAITALRARLATLTGQKVISTGGDPLHQEHGMRMTLGRGAIIPAVRRAVWPSALVLALTIAVVVYTGKSGWLTVGGAIITALGARLLARRILRQRPERADDPPLPATLPGPPGAKAVQLNVAALNDMQQRALDNWNAVFGVWVTIAGAIIGGAGPFVVDQVRALLP